MSEPVILEAVQLDPLAHLLRVRVKSSELHCSIETLLPSPAVPQHWHAPYFGLMQCFGVDHAGKPVRAAVSELENKIGIAADVPDWIIASSPRQS